VKWLGDGVMFHFADPGRAILSGLDLVEHTESAISVPARVGINAGAVIIQEGDYFGRTVNIAARIADYARPHEILVSDEAKRSANVADVDFELIGDVPLKGVSTSVRLHKATRTDSQRDDGQCLRQRRRGPTRAPTAGRRPADVTGWPPKRP